MPRNYKAKNTIDYVSIRTGTEKRVVPGDVFSDMNSVAVRNELEHGNIVECTEEGEELR